MTYAITSIIHQPATSPASSMRRTWRQSIDRRMVDHEAAAKARHSTDEEGDT